VFVIALPHKTKVDTKHYILLKVIKKSTSTQRENGLMPKLGSSANR